MIAPATTPKLGALGALGAHGALGTLAMCCRACDLGLPCESRGSRGQGGALAGIGDIITGIVGAVTGTIQGFQQEHQNDTDRYWAGNADQRYAEWLDYWTRTGEIPAPNCTTNREGAPWCARAWERFLMTVNASEQITLRTFATPEVIVAGILFVLAVRASAA